MDPAKNINKPSISVLMMGDPENQASVRTKFSFMLDEVTQQVKLISVFDTNIKGWRRILSMIRNFSPKLYLWRQRFYKNIPAFQDRSQLAQSHVQDMADQIDVTLQISAMFNAYCPELNIPNVVYADYTSYLSAISDYSGRSPLKQEKLKQWLALETEVYEQAAHICTRSEHVKRSLISHYHIPDDKISVVYGGYNFQELPQETAHENQVPTILFIGKTFYRKGGDVLLKAFAKARQQVPESQLRMVTHYIPPEFDMTNVELLPPNSDRDVIASYFSSSDIFVLPSRLETWGDVLLEAMAYGLPCIGVTGEAMEEIIVQEETGLLVPPDDVDALAEALVRLLQDQQMRQRYGQRGRQRVQQIFTWKAVVNRIVQVVEQVLE